MTFKRSLRALRTWRCLAAEAKCSFIHSNLPTMLIVSSCVPPSHLTIFFDIFISAPSLPRGIRLLAQVSITANDSWLFAPFLAMALQCFLDLDLVCTANPIDELVVLSDYIWKIQLRAVPEEWKPYTDHRLERALRYHRKSLQDSLGQDRRERGWSVAIAISVSEQVDTRYSKLP